MSENDSEDQLATRRWPPVHTQNQYIMENLVAEKLQLLWDRIVATRDIVIYYASVGVLGMLNEDAKNSVSEYMRNFHLFFPSTKSSLLICTDSLNFTPPKGLPSES